MADVDAASSKSPMVLHERGLGVGPEQVSSIKFKKHMIVAETYA